MVTVGNEPTFTRRRISEPDPVPLAFAFDSNPAGPEHLVTVVSWTDVARQALRDLSQHLSGLERRQSLPVEGLRGRLEVHDPGNLRLDRGLGLWSVRPSILWTSCDPATATGHVGNAVTGWATDDLIGNDASVRDTARRLRHLASDGGLVTAARRRAHVFAWERSRSGTTICAATNREGYADLADFAARCLEGEELLPGCGPLRRVAGGRLDSNQAELMTEPLVVGTNSFSVVLRLQVLSYPGRATPIVTLDLSRRMWTRRLKGASARELICYALPDGSKVALRFSFQRQRSDAAGQVVHTYRAGGDFPPIARHYGLDLPMTAEDIVTRGHALGGCRLLVPNVPGVGERSGGKRGVPDLDKMTAFRRAAELLAPVGLRAWLGLVDVPTGTQVVKDRNERWRDRDEAHEQAYQEWQESAKRDLSDCYAGAHHVVVGYHQSLYEDAKRVQDLLQELLDGRVQAQLIPIPDDVHGPRQALPRPDGDRPGNRERAELRARAWRPFIAAVRRYQDDAGASIDGLLILAPIWFGERKHDDVVNKRAGRITLARELRVPVQYLLPERGIGQKFHSKQDPAKLFERRIVMAWLDLAWKSIGRIDMTKMTEAVTDIYGTASEVGAAQVLPPDRVLAVGVVRTNRTVRRANQASVVPYAIELDLQRGVCSARFARGRAPRFDITPVLPLARALAELASSGPVQLTDGSSGRREQLQERCQRFFHTVISDFCQTAKRPLVLIDALTCRDVWPWVADARLDPSNVVIGDHMHAEADWGDDVRIVRVRTENSPKVLYGGRLIGHCAETGEEVDYEAPKWAEAQLLKLDGGQSDVYLSFGSLLRTNLIRGISCYRRIDGLAVTGKPRRCVKGTLEPFTRAWSTPNGVELTVVRTARGEQSDQLAQFVEWLRTVFIHFGDWSTRPAPLHFERALRDYIADYDLDEEDDDGRIDETDDDDEENDGLAE